MKLSVIIVTLESLATLTTLMSSQTFSVRVDGTFVKVGCDNDQFEVSKFCIAGVKLPKDTVKLHSAVAKLIEFE